MKKFILGSSLVILITFVALLEVSAGAHHKIDSKKESKQNQNYPKKRLWSQYIVVEDSVFNLGFEIVGRYNKKVQKETLLKAQSLADIIPYYPTNWISEYDVVEILTTGKGVALKAYGYNDQLNQLQKNILAESDLGSTLYINVSYKYQNPLTQVLEENQMHANLMVVPYVEATFAGGDEKMSNYFHENIIQHLNASIPKQNVEVAFTINQKGEITQVNITKSSDNPKTDELLLEKVSTMPKWIPAENSKGKKVSQKFTLRIGQNQEGC